LTPNGSVILANEITMLIDSKWFCYLFEDWESKRHNPQPFWKEENTRNKTSIT